MAQDNIDPALKIANARLMRDKVSAIIKDN